MMNGSVTPPSGDHLFASKGGAVPSPRLPAIPPLASRGAELMRATGPATGTATGTVTGTVQAVIAGGQRRNSPLAFLISRQPVVITSPSVDHDGGAKALVAVPPFMLSAATSRGTTRARQPRRSLTLRLSVAHYFRFRECAAIGETTLQGLLEALVLRFLASEDLPPTRQVPDFSPRSDIKD